MKVLVNGEVKELVAIGINGVDWSENFVCAGERSEFEWVESDEDWGEGYWQCSQEDFDWWKAVCEKQSVIYWATETEQFKELSEDEKDEFYSFASDDIGDAENHQIEWLKAKGILND